MYRYDVFFRYIVTIPPPIIFLAGFSLRCIVTMYLKNTSCVIPPPRYYWWGLFARCIFEMHSAQCISKMHRVRFHQVLLMKFLSWCIFQIHRAQIHHLNTIGEVIFSRDVFLRYMVPSVSVSYTRDNSTTYLLLVVFWCTTCLWDTSLTFSNIGRGFRLDAVLSSRCIWKIHWTQNPYQ